MDTAKNSGYKMEQILDLIKSLSCSQGFYGRLYRDLMMLRSDDLDAYNEVVEELESQNFTSDLDVILYLET